MKHILLVFLVICSTLMFSQTFNSAWHGGINSSYDIVTINSRSYYLYSQKSVPGCCGFSMRIACRDKLGVLVFDALLTSEQGYPYGNICKTFDQATLSFGGTSMKGCDTGGYRTTVEKRDTNGVLLWSFQFLGKINSLIPKPDNGFYMIALNNLYKYDSGGNLISFIALPGTGGSSGSCLNNSSQLVVSTATFLSTFDTTGTLISQQTPGILFTKLVCVPTGSFFGVSSAGHLVKLAPVQVTVASTATLTPPLPGITNFQLRNDTFYVCGRDNSITPYFSLLDMNFQSIYQSSTNLENVTPTGISLADDNTLRIISTGAGGYAHSFNGYFQTQKSGNLSGIKDIGVTACSILQNTVSLLTFWSASVNAFQVSMNASATVKNFGNDTLHQFRLNYYSYTGGVFPCYFGLCQQFTATIPPGGTVSVLTNSFSTGITNIMGLSAAGTYTDNVCLYATVPDNTNDTDIQNNSACITTTYQVLGINEMEKDILVSLFPNPATNKINIQSDKTIDELGLYDLSGRSLVKFSPGTKDTYIDVNELPSGIYLIELKSGSSRGFRKISVLRE